MQFEVLYLSSVSPIYTHVNNKKKKAFKLTKSEYFFNLLIKTINALRTEVLYELL